jgi:hypothetical protein
VGTRTGSSRPTSSAGWRSARGATISEVAASHVSMISKPQATIDAILAAVAATSD